jgi:predicted dehydrogenase
LPDGRPYRGAIIGLGGVARTAHLPGFRYDAATRRRIEIVAAVDSDPRAAEGADIPVVSDWTELRELAGHRPLDFVDVCTPTGSHAATTVAALAAGYHVLCEKPVALDPAQARTIAAAARAAGRTVMPCHQYRFNPAWRRMREWLQGDAIGPWHLAELSVYRTAADHGAGRSAVPWRGSRQDGAGGILLDHGTHLLYTLLDIAGPPTAVRGWTARLRHHDYDVEDTAEVVLEYPDRVATIFLTWAARHRETRVRFTGERGTIEWIGGLLRLDAAGRTETIDMSAELDKAMYPAWFAELFRSFADALDLGGTVPQPLADIGQVATLLDAAYRAAESGARVPFDPHLTA